MVQQGSVIIFVAKREACDILSNNLTTQGYFCAALHGEKDQNERTKIMHAFKHGNFPILIATDVAARGLDVETVRNVVNYDTAKNIESHIHRIGRTGRAGQEGVAYTFITPKEVNF